MQDWTPVTLNKSSGAGGSKVAAANKAAGLRAVSLKPEHVAKAARLDAASEAVGIEKMPRNVVKQLTVARIAKGLTQKQLATNLNITHKSINDLESFKHDNDPKLINRIARSLGCEITK